jgi:hypothetical protein
MANPIHIDILYQGVEVWNAWRQKNPDIQPDLREANLRLGYIFSGNFVDRDFAGANFSGADFRGANLSGRDFSKANFSGADLREANLQWAILSETNFSGADLRGCSIYAISAWNVKLINTRQASLIITRPDESTITVDNLEVAQFIYLLLNNEKIRDVIDTITSKAVLILGRFTPERKRVLDVLRDELRKKGYLPIVFDFDVPTNRNVTETVTTLARLSRFIIADITDPKSIPQELAFIVPDLPSVPVQPLLHARSKEYGMYDHFKNFPWVLEAYRYTTVDRLLASLREHVIEPAEKKVRELAIEKTKQLEKL